MPFKSSFEKKVVLKKKTRGNVQQEEQAEQYSQAASFDEI